MADAIAVLNAGSSSIKFSLFAQAGGDLALKLRGQAEGIHTAPRFVAKNAGGETISSHSWDEGKPLGHEGALEHIVAFVRDRLEGLSLVGHRAPRRARRARVRAAGARRPQGAGRSGAVHPAGPAAPAAQPDADPASARAPRRTCRRWPASTHRSIARSRSSHRCSRCPRICTTPGVRRYGFHGLSYEYIASMLPKLDARAASGRTVVLHLGNGASMCALSAGRSVASTMGFTAVDGLPMGTRCGAIDPGVLLYLMDQRGMDTRAIEKLIYSQSGLLGVSGVSSDMRTLLASGEPRARLAVDLYVYRIGRELGSLAASLGGLDALVFTGGIGENSAEIRERVCRDAAWLGVVLDEQANQQRRAAHQHGRERDHGVGAPHQRGTDDCAPHRTLAGALSERERCNPPFPIPF